jgi:thiol-disulfide isomerase/thioredoxin
VFVPYGKLQQGRAVAANPSELRVDAHLGLVQAQASAPTGTSLIVELPVGALRSSTVDATRIDEGAGDLELRVRQELGRFLGARALGFALSLGVVVPSGAYTARSGAANLAPEASYLTLGRGVTWWIAEADARLTLGRRGAVLGQLSARRPFGRTEDGFSWGPEVRASVGGQLVVWPRLALSATSDLQWRGGASEPDPFSDGRLTSANAGGWQWSVSPTIVFLAPHGLSIAAGVRVPVYADVRGNQLVPQVGAFITLGYSRQLGGRVQLRPTLGQITVVDYWASWCAPCLEVAAILEAAARDWPDVRVERVDASQWTPEELGRRVPGATGLPLVEIYDRDGRRRIQLRGPEAAQVVDAVEALRRDSAK